MSLKIWVSSWRKLFCRVQFWFWGNEFFCWVRIDFQVYFKLNFWVLFRYILTNEELYCKDNNEVLVQNTKVSNNPLKPAFFSHKLLIADQSMQLLKELINLELKYYFLPNIKHRSIENYFKQSIKISVFQFYFLPIILIRILLLVVRFLS